MRASIYLAHKNFFKYEDYISFDEVFKTEEMDSLLPIFEPLDKFSEGRDLWRQSALLQKLFFRKDLCSIAKELFGEKDLRFGYDQSLLNIPPLWQDWQLRTHSSIQGLSGALLICYAPLPKNLSEESLDPLLPTVPGQVLFLSPEKKIHFPSEGLPIILLAYAKKTALYIKNTQDPHNHHLQSLGYNYGDRLKSRSHPSF